MKFIPNTNGSSVLEVPACVGIPCRQCIYKEPASISVYKDLPVWRCGFYKVEEFFNYEDDTQF